MKIGDQIPFRRTLRARWWALALFVQLISGCNRSVTPSEPEGTGGSDGGESSSGGESSTGGSDTDPRSGGAGPTGSGGLDNSGGSDGSGGTDQVLPYACYDRVDVAVGGECPQHDSAFLEEHGYSQLERGGCFMSLLEDPVAPPPSAFSFEEFEAPLNGSDPDCDYRDCCRHGLTHGDEAVCLFAPEGADLCCYALAEMVCGR